MTNRTSPKKVVKNIDKPKSHNIKWQIIKHFDPSTNYATNHKSLNIRIPINVDSDNVERHVPRAPYTTLKKQNATKKMTIAREANSIDFKKNKKPCNDKGPNLYKAQPQQKNRTKPFIHLCYTSSSSSLEQNSERFSSHCKSLKSKSFHDESFKRPNQIKRSPKSAQTNVYPSQKSFKSITDSSLIEKRLQLKSLREEILENQRITSPQKYGPNSFTYKGRLQDLKSEILQAQTNNILHNKILITELRSEIGHYKKFSNFQVYNSYEGELNKNPENEGRANKTKSIQKEQSTPRKDSISDEDFEKLECGICSSSQNISDCQGRSSGERSKSGTGNKTRSIRKEQSTRRKDSISDEDFEELECGICSSSQNISDCQGRSSRERSKSGTGNKTRSIRKEQSTRRKDSISDEDFEKLECGICLSSSDCQGRSSRERSKSGTDKESTLDPTDRQSISTIDGSRRASRQRKQLSDPESLDDVVIRNKIHEANLLIDRVKKALGKIKAIKTSADEECGVRTASSTDIEETIKNLKMETENLITGDSDLLGMKSKVKCPSLCPKRLGDKTKDCFSNNDELNNTFIKENERRCCQNIRPIKSVTKIPILVPRFEALDNVEPKPAYSGKYPCVRDDIDLDRPKTRRNELEDDLPEPIRRDKFRTCPENGHLAISSSIEELQAKLQTISESTESSYSTPRVNQKDSTENKLDAKCCTSDPPRTESKQMQAAASQTTTETDVFCCSTEDKCTQVIVMKPLIKHVQIESLSPTRKCLKSMNLPPEEIHIKQRCTSCKIEYLPILELLPPKEKQICDKCKKELKEERLEGISIPSKAAKLQKLSIKILPPVIIQQALMLTPVLILSISPEGVSENQVKNTQNVGFFEISSPNTTPKTTCCSPIIEKDVGKDAEVGTVLSLNNDKRDADLLKVHYAQNSEPQVSKNLPGDSEIEIAIQDLLDDQETNDPEKEPVTSPQPEVPENVSLNDRTIRDIVYQSYLIYDNPNQHDPGILDQKSKEKVSHIDSEFYKAFINPNQNMTITSDQPLSSSTSRHKIMGFESKTVQCDECMLLCEDQLAQCSGDDGSKISSPDEKDVKKASESELTLDKFQDMRSDSRKKQMESTIAMHGSVTESTYSSPSEITVTISYSGSYDESGKLEDKSIAVIHETEIKTTNLDHIIRESQVEGKMLPSVDKKLITKLHEKLKSVDVTASVPTLIIKKDSTDDVDTLDNFLKGLIHYEEQKSKDSIRSSEGNRKSSEKHIESVNYLLSGNVGALRSSYTNPLELAKNGRFRDEQNMFTQMPHPTIKSTHQRVNNEPEHGKFKKVKPTAFEHRDTEVAKDKFVTIPRHRLNRYAPDTSNSDTVTSNSVSEGEVACRHSVSNGEIHVCRHSPQCPRPRKNILTRRKHTYPQPHRSPFHFISHGPKKFDLNDPKVTIEHRRNYFNNWVTYYVRPQDVCESTASSCSNNKK